MINLVMRHHHGNDLNTLCKENKIYLYKYIKAYKIKHSSKETSIVWRLLAGSKWFVRKCLFAKLVSRFPKCKAMAIVQSEPALSQPMLQFPHYYTRA
jgi:hypothetical protein